MPPTPTSNDLRLNLAFSALSDTLRREMVEMVLNQPGISVNELCARFPVSRFTIMRNLNALEEAKLIIRKRKGKEKHIYIEQKAFAALTQGWLAQIANSKQGNEQ